MQQETAFGIDRPAEIDLDLALDAVSVQAEAIEQLGGGHGPHGHVDDQAHGAVPVVLDHVDHRLLEAGIAHLLRGDEQAPGQAVVPGALGRRGQARRRRRHSEDGDQGREERRDEPAGARAAVHRERFGRGGFGHRYLGLVRRRAQSSEAAGPTGNRFSGRKAPGAGLTLDNFLVTGGRDQGLLWLGRRNAGNP